MRLLLWHKLARKIKFRWIRCPKANLNFIWMDFSETPFKNLSNNFQFQTFKIHQNASISNFHEYRLLPLDSTKRKSSTIYRRQIASMNEGIFSIVCSAYDKFLVIYLNFPCLSVAIRKKFIHARKAKQMFLISEFVFRFFRLKAWLEVMSCSAVIFLK